MGQKIQTYGFVRGKLEEKRQLGRPNCRWKNISDGS